MKQIRRRLSYANVVATLALFVALGGASYAATKLPTNSVKAPQIANNAVGSSELRTGAVHSSDISEELANRFRAATGPFVPPRGADPCAVFAGVGAPACINVKSKTYSLGFLASRTFRLSCPQGSLMVPNRHAINLLLISFTIDTNSPHYSGLNLPLGLRKGSFTFTNWSTHRHSFTGYTACLRT